MGNEQTGAEEANPAPWSYDFTKGTVSDANGKVVARLSARVQTSSDPFGEAVGNRIADAVNELTRLRSRITDLETALVPDGRPFSADKATELAVGMDDPVAAIDMLGDWLEGVWETAARVLTKGRK